MHAVIKVVLLGVASVVAAMQPPKIERGQSLTGPCRDPRGPCATQCCRTFDRDIDACVRLPGQDERFACYGAAWDKRDRCLAGCSS
jgi:hypothetical protein